MSIFESYSYARKSTLLILLLPDDEMTLKDCEIGKILQKLLYIWMTEIKGTIF